MRPSKFILPIVAILAVLLLADILAGTLVDITVGEGKKNGGSRTQISPPITQVKNNKPTISAPIEESELTSPTRRFATHTHKLLTHDTLALLNAPNAAIDLSKPRSIGQYETPERVICNEELFEATKDSKSNEQFALFFTDIFMNAFSPHGIPWWLDEGGLIGSSRAGSMSNADDDFDFFALLPNQTAPCSPNSTTCTNEEFNAYIHRFLMVFWRKGMCINKFHPDPALFKSNMRLMYSLQLNRDDSLPPEKCFKESKPFAHMHLGILVDNSEKGEIETNVWAKHTTHPVDKLPLALALPTSRCRVGSVEAPCPNDIVGYLHVRNRGEYFKKSSDGSCLLIRNKWNKEKRIKAVETIENLAACGYNTMIALAPALRANDYNSC